MPQADLLAVLAKSRHRRLLLGAAAVVCAGVLVWLQTGQLGRFSRPAVAPDAVRLSAAVPAPVLRSKPLAEWLETIAREAGSGLVLGPDLGTDVTAVFPPATPWRDRLDALARVHGFTYRSGDGVIEVLPSPPPPLALQGRSEPAGVAALVREYSHPIPKFGNLR